MSINDSISRVRSLLLSPKAQKPTLSELFTHLTFEYQNYYNELENTNQAWTYNAVDVNVQSGTTDYIVPASTGKVLFVTAYPNNTSYAPVSLEFADLAEVTSDFFLYSPLDFGISRGFNENFNVPFPAQIAFYRKDNDLWFRLPPFAYELTRLTITFSTGNWIDNLNTASTAILSQHHQLPDTRTAINVLAGAEWTDNLDADEMKRRNLERSLSRTEMRYAETFMYAKRNLTADMVTVRDTW